jgi:hypothetical protein
LLANSNLYRYNKAKAKRRPMDAGGDDEWYDMVGLSAQVEGSGPITSERPVSTLEPVKPFFSFLFRFFYFPIYLFIYFVFQLCHYNTEDDFIDDDELDEYFERNGRKDKLGGKGGGAFTRLPVEISLPVACKAPVFIPCAYEVISWFRAFAFKCNLYRYKAGTGSTSTRGISSSWTTARGRKTPWRHPTRGGVSLPALAEEEEEAVAEEEVEEEVEGGS